MQSMHENQVIAVWHRPFEIGSPHVEAWKEGMSLAQIAERIPGLPEEFATHGSIQVNGSEIPKGLWHLVKPKPNTEAKPVMVTLHMVPQGGGGGGDADGRQSGKNVFALVAAIALTVVTQGIAGGSLATSSGLFAQGTLSAKLLAAGVSLVGALVIGALTAPPAITPTESDSNSGKNPASAQGNLLSPNASVPRVLGTRRLFPPFIMEPYVELVGQNEFVTAVTGLSGPHIQTDIRVGDNSIDLANLDVGDIDVEVHDGRTPYDSNYLRRYARTIQYNTPMSAHEEDPDNPDQVISTSTGLPVWHGVGSKESPDKIWVHMGLQALAQDGDTTVDLRVPFRVRFKRRGETTWINCPEIHYKGATNAARRTQITFEFMDPADLPSDSAVGAVDDLGFTEARIFSPGQVLSPATSDFNANSYFDNGTGSVDYLDSSTTATTKVTNMRSDNNGVHFFLDKTIFTPGFYDIEIIRGATLLNSNYDPAAYEYSSVIWDFFGFQGAGLMPLSRKGIVDTFGITRSVSVWDQSPILTNDLALIAVRAQNRSVEQISTLASAYTRELSVPDDPGGVATYSIAALTHGVAPTSTERNQNVRFEMNTPFPETPEDAILCEFGGTGNGFAAYVHEDGKTFRVQEGNGTVGEFEPATDRSIITIPTRLLPFDGQVHHVMIQVNRDGGQLDLWIDRVHRGHARRVEPRIVGEWAGSNVGGYLTAPSGSIAGVNTLPDWPVSAGATNLLVFTDADLIDKDTQDFNGLAPSNNPATWFNDVLVSEFNIDPLPLALRDLDALREWHDACWQSDYTVDYIAEGVPINDILRVIASNGFARPYQSELWGVIRDYDRSAEDPIQTFTMQNSSGFTWAKAFPRLPKGLRVNYTDEALDYTAQQVVIDRANFPDATERYEQTTYEGFVDRDKVINRADFDLQQAQLRATFYTLRVPFEWVRCRRGSLVGVEHDTLGKVFGRGRVAQVLEANGLITGLILDNELPSFNAAGLETVEDLTAEEDLTEFGIIQGCAIRRNDGTITVHQITVSEGDNQVIAISTPFANASIPGGNYDFGNINAVDEGCLVIVGEMDTVYKRLIVNDIQPGENLEASLTLVDEAPELWS